MFGSVYPWAYSILELTTALMFGAWIVRTYVLAKTTAPKVPNLKLFLPAFLFIVLLLIQLIPFPANVLNMLSPKTAEIYTLYSPDISVENPSSRSITAVFLPNLDSFERCENGLYSLTLSRIGTRREALLLLTYFALLFLFINYSPNGSVRTFLKRIVFSIVISGSLVAFIGLFQRMLRFEYIYGFWRPFHTSDKMFMGPYVNANHFSGYVELTLPITLALFISWVLSMKRPRLHDHRSTMELVQNQEYNKAFLVFLGVLLIFMALVLSLSRAGIVSFFLAWVWVWYLHEWVQRRFLPEKWANLRKIRRILFVFLLFFFVVSAAFVFLQKTDEFHGISEAARFSVWQDSWRMFKDFPLFGTGLNSFFVVFPSYKTRVGASSFTHSENDYLQLLAETGILGFLCMMIFFLIFFMEIKRIFFWRVRDSLATREAKVKEVSSSLSRNLRYKDLKNNNTKRNTAYPLPQANYFLFLGCVWALATIALHSLTDFNLHIPANALLFFLLMGVIYRLVRLRKTLFSFSERKVHPN